MLSGALTGFWDKLDVEMGFARKTAHRNSGSEIAVISLRVKSHDDWSGNEKAEQGAKILSEIVKKLEESGVKIKVTTASGRGIGFVC
jgi:hypothetical protein